MANVQEAAHDWAKLQGELSYLKNLMKEDVLNEEQTDNVMDYMGYIQEQVENLEFNILEVDADGSFYHEVRLIADNMNIEPSQEFIDGLDAQLSELTMDGIEYQIHTAVEEFNSFYYSCEITINSHGYVSFSGGSFEGWKDYNVLAKKGPGYKKISVEDVKRKIEQLKIA